MRAKRMNIISAALAVGLVCISSARNADAYFTTYVTAKGGYAVSWEHHEEIRETIKDREKSVTIASKKGSIPVYVRVKAFAGSSYELVYKSEENNGIAEWKAGADGYYYCSSVLQGGEETKALKIRINNVPKTPKEGMDFNVVVVYETIPVQYDANGEMVKPEAANWTQSETSQMTYGE